VLGEARQQIIDLFTGTFGYTHVSDLGMDPTEAQLTGHLRALCRHRVRPQDYLVVYIAGHGEVLDGGRHVLLTADTDPHDIPDALSTMRLADKMLLGTPLQRLLLLLDTCYSGQGGNQIAAAVLTGMEREWTGSDRPGLVVVTSTQPFEQADTGAFPALLSQAIHNRPTAGQVPPSLELGAVVDAMNSNSDRPQHQRIGMIALGLTGHIPDFLPNPRHRPGMTDIDLHMQQVAEWDTHAERREVEFRRRFLVRAMGGPTDAPAWWFTGRHAALTDIASWLASPAQPAALIVTGGPGSGKTAVLGLVSALAHPEDRRTVPLDALDLPQGAVPPLGAIDVTIYAGGLTHDQVLAGIAAAARIDAKTVSELLAGVGAQRASRGRVFTAVIDALDEAADPQQLVSQVLRPIIEYDHCRTIRLLLGTRPHLLGLLNPPGNSYGAAVATIGLDSDLYADQTALTAYTIRCLLEASPHSRYLDIPPEQARAVAVAVAEAATPSFLVARITSTTLAWEQSIADPRDPPWLASLPRLPSDAMRADLDTRLGEEAQRARDLLRPLAYAEGQGLPWENIWAPLATAISRNEYSDADLFWLRAHAGSYVVEATEAGRSAYRLYHQALTEYLRADTEAIGLDEPAVQQAFVEILSRVPRTMDATRDWNRAHPYALRHLATHAALAGSVDALLTDPEYLVHADPDTLLRALPHARTRDGQRAGVIYRASADRHRHASRKTRRQLLAIDAARHGAVAMCDALSTDLPWRPRWATGTLTRSSLRLTLPGHTQPVQAIACTQIDGVPVAVAGSGTILGSGELRVWDLRTGQQRFSLTSPQIVSAVACTHIDGVPIAIADYRGESVVWDLRTGQQRAAFGGHSLMITAMTCTQIDGVPVAITVGGTPNLRENAEVGEAFVWDLRTGQQRFALPSSTQLATAVACGQVDDVPIAVVAHGGEATVWDLRTGQQRIVLTAHQQSISAVACAVVDSVPVAITAADTEVLIWDLRTGRQRTMLTGHTQPVTAITCAQIGDIPVAVTGAGIVRVSGGAVGDGEILMWDLRTGQQRGVLAEHTLPVNAVACDVVDGVPVALSGSGNSFGGGDSELLVWDLRAVSDSIALSGHSQPLTGAACTQIDNVPVVITSASTAAGTILGGVTVGEILVWDLRTGHQRAALSGHTLPVNAVACCVVEDIPVAITGGGKIAGGPAGEALVWDLRTGQQRAALSGHTLPVNAVACGKIGDIPVAVTGGGTIFGKNHAEVLVWDLCTGRRRGVLVGHKLPVNAVACGQIGNVPVAITGGGSIHNGDSAEVLTWDLRTGRRRATLTGHSQPVRAVACTQIDNIPVAITAASARANAGAGLFDSPSHLHSGDNAEVFLWDLRTGRRRATLTGHSQPVRAVACTQIDNIPVAIIGTGEALLVWNLLTCQQQETFAMPHEVAAVAIGAGHEIAVGAAIEVITLEPLAASTSLL
jgi:WD40 repeat protein